MKKRKTAGEFIQSHRGDFIFYPVMLCAIAGFIYAMNAADTKDAEAAAVRSDAVSALTEEYNIKALDVPEAYHTLKPGIYVTDNPGLPGDEQCALTVAYGDQGSLDDGTPKRLLVFDCN